MNTILLAGTQKGLLILGEKYGWKINAIHFEGLAVSMVHVDERTDTWWVGISHKHWGEKPHYSKDHGKSWHTVEGPHYTNHEYRPGIPATLEKIWVMQQAGPDKPGGLWLGTEPGSLFYSVNNGIYFQLVEGLWNHPSRMDDQQWFGTGKDFPFIHSIQVDPRDSNHVYVGISCAGIFETKDGGHHWEPKNNGLKAAYLPVPNVPVGHDPHCVLLCKSNPDVLWQQNHCGIFRTTDGGNNWKDVSGESGFPNYGFALAIDHQNPDTAWVIPVKSDTHRIPINLKLTVCKTKDGGKNWIQQDHGLPDGSAFDIALRQAFVRKNQFLAFGTNNGNLYLSENDGENWKSISTHLATVHCLAIL